MILTDKEIRELVQGKLPLIEQFKEDSLQSESYDLTIGDNISRIDANMKVLYLDDQTEIDQIYIKEKIPRGGYLLGAGEFIFVSTEEKLNIPEQLTAHVRPRTKFTRLGLLVSGQHCNSSFSGKLSLGLLNTNNFVVCIAPGLRIAQIVFEELKEIPSRGKQYREKRGEFQNETELRSPKLKEEYAVSDTSEPQLHGEAQRAYQMLLDGLRHEEREK